jgi:hypothetical protein
VAFTGFTTGAIVCLNGGATFTGAGSGYDTFTGAGSGATFTGFTVVAYNHLEQDQQSLAAAQAKLTEVQAKEQSALDFFSFKFLG